MTVHKLTTWTTVSAREDLTGYRTPMVVVQVNRQDRHTDRNVEFEMTPKDARALSRKLSKYAKFAEQS
jgi:hypothetical protein